MIHLALVLSFILCLQICIISVLGVIVSTCTTLYQLARYRHVESTQIVTNVLLCGFVAIAILVTIIIVQFI